MLLVAAAGGSYKAAITLNVDVWEELSQGAEDGSELLVLKGEPYNDPPARAAIADLPEDPRELMGPGAERNENLAVLYVMAARLARMGGLPQRPPIEGAYQVCCAAPFRPRADPSASSSPLCALLLLCCSPPPPPLCADPSASSSPLGGCRASSP